MNLTVMSQRHIIPNECVVETHDVKRKKFYGHLIPLHTVIDFMPTWSQHNLLIVTVILILNGSASISRNRICCFITPLLVIKSKLILIDAFPIFHYGTRQANSTSVINCLRSTNIASWECFLCGWSSKPEVAIFVDLILGSSGFETQSALRKGVYFFTALDRESDNLNLWTGFSNTEPISDGDQL